MLADDILGALSGVPGAKDTCSRSVAAEVVTRLGKDYRREEQPDMPRPRLRATGVEDVRVELELAVKEDPELPPIFRDWRTAVHDLEARNAGRLRVLLGVARDLNTMADLDDDPEPARKMSAVLADWLLREWELRDFGLDDDFRELCIVRTRRYDLLPKAWRYV